MEHNEDNVSETIVLKDNSKRAKIAIYILIGICFMNIIAIISSYYQIELLERVKNGDYVGYEEADSNDIREGIIGLFQAILNILSIIFFLLWFRRAYGNTHQFSKQLEQSPSMAVWSFVIPIVSLYRPYQIAKEILVKTHKKIKEIIPDYNITCNFAILGFWWALFIITNFISQIAIRSVFKDDTVVQLITSSQLYLFSDFTDIFAALITILLIRQISKKEDLLYNNINNTVVTYENKIQENIL